MSRTTLLASNKHRWLYGIVGCYTTIIAMTANATPNSDNINEILSLSLEELLSIRIEGASVRTVGFSIAPESGNPFNLNLSRTPASVEIIEQNTIRARGLKNVIEAAENLVGVISGDTPGDPYSFSMRGFSGNSVNLLYDGISLGLSSLNMRPLGTYHLERLEIIKGASSLHGGEGGAGGAINLISSKPTLNGSQKSSALISYGNYNSSTINLDVAGPLTTDSAYRVVIANNMSEGWIYDTHSNSLNITASTVTQLSDSASLDFSIQYLDDSLPAYWGTPLIPRDIATKELKGVVSTDNGTVLDAATRFTNYNVDDHVIDSDNLWLRSTLNWQLTNSIKNKTTLYHFGADRHWRNAETYSFDMDSEKIGRDRFLVTHDRSLIGLRSEFSWENSVFGLQNQSNLSLEYSDGTLARQIGFDVNNALVDLVDIYHPDAGTFGKVDTRHDNMKTEISALVIYDELQLAKQWQLNLVGRYENIGVTRLRYNFANELIARTSLDKDFQQASYRVGLVRSITENISSYIQFAKQHDPLEGDFSSVYNLVNFEASNIAQQELGIKANLLDSKLQISTSVYRLKKLSKLQLADMQPERNEQKSQGAEIAASASISDNLRIGGNFSYIDAEFGHYIDPNTEMDTSGNAPTNVPHQSASVWSSVKPFANNPLEIGGGLNYISSRFANTQNTIELQSYTLTNVFAAYTTANYRVALNIRNLTDKVYAPWSDINYPNQIQLGAPRTYEVSFHIKF